MTDLVVSGDITALAAAYLLSIDTIAAEVGARAGEKLLPKDAPVRFPALRITEISTADGDVVDGWARSLVQVDCFHTTRAGAADLARDVSAALVASANWSGAGFVLGRTETVRRRPAHDDTAFDPAQPRWIVSGHLFAKPA